MANIRVMIRHTWLLIDTLARFKQECRIVVNIRVMIRHTWLSIDTLARFGQRRQSRTAKHDSAIVFFRDRVPVMVLAKSEKILKLFSNDSTFLSLYLESKNISVCHHWQFEIQKKSYRLNLI